VRRPEPVQLTPNPKATSSLQKLQAALLADNAIKLTSMKKVKVQAALDWWAYDGDTDGQRDANFFRLGGRLHRAGCDEYEFKEYLRTAAASARGSQSELRAKINRIWAKVVK
jgi:hypothetical protein